jgi:hypothetical protein
MTLKKPNLTKNHQKNSNAQNFMETILLSVMIYIMIKLPTMVFPPTIIKATTLSTKHPEAEK